MGRPFKRLLRSEAPCPLPYKLASTLRTFMFPSSVRQRLRAHIFGAGTWSSSPAPLRRLPASHLASSLGHQSDRAVLRNGFHILGICRNRFVMHHRLANLLPHLFRSRAFFACNLVPDISPCRSFARDGPLNIKSSVACAPQQANPVNDVATRLNHCMRPGWELV